MSSGESLDGENLVVREHTRSYNFELLIQSSTRRIQAIEVDDSLDWDDKHQAIKQALFSENSKLEEHGFINADSIIGVEDAYIPGNYDLSACMIGEDRLFGPYWGLEYVPVDDLQSEWRLVHQMFIGTREVQTRNERGLLDVVVSLPIDSPDIWLFEPQESKLPDTPTLLRLCEPLFGLSTGEYNWQVVADIFECVKQVNTNPLMQRKNIDWFIKEFNIYARFGTNNLMVATSELITQKITGSHDDINDMEQLPAELHIVPDEASAYSVGGKLLGFTEVSEYQVVEFPNQNLKGFRRIPGKTCMAVVLEYRKDGEFITATVPLRHCVEIQGIFE